MVVLSNYTSICDVKKNDSTKCACHWRTMHNGDVTMTYPWYRHCRRRSVYRQDVDELSESYWVDISPYFCLHSAKKHTEDSLRMGWNCFKCQDSEDGQEEEGKGIFVPFCVWCSCMRSFDAPASEVLSIYACGSKSNLKGPTYELKSYYLTPCKLSLTSKGKFIQCWVIYLCLETDIHAAFNQYKRFRPAIARPFLKTTFNTNSWKYRAIQKEFRHRMLA